ncbi:MAG: S8 family serine peptidase [Candidatus Sericytochromatia bacterium]|nr:S8 family serine peptidase [Candidatus Sericytochromatia bacterium]
MTPIRVAIIDSGINPQHSHVQAVAAGVSFHVAADGAIVAGEDWRDRFGHGTAVAGAVRLFAPAAELLAINVVDGQGRSSAEQLVAAIVWAIRHEATIINLSLGTANPEHAGMLSEAVDLALASGATVVAAAPSQGAVLWPAALPQVIGVKSDERLAPKSIGFMAEHDPPWRAFGRPRALPGPAQAKNFKGSSFAAARLSGMLARQASVSGERNRATLIAWLHETAVPLTAEAPQAI